MHWIVALAITGYQDVGCVMQSLQIIPKYRREKYTNFVNSTVQLRTGTRIQKHEKRHQIMFEH